jgi:hypothetical protein
LWSKILHKTHILIIQYPIHTGFFISLMLVYLSDIFYILLHKSRNYIFDPWRTVTTIGTRILYSRLLATTTINGVWNLIIYRESKKRLPYLFFSSFFLHFFSWKRCQKGAIFGPPIFGEVYAFLALSYRPTTILPFGFFCKNGNLPILW